MFKATLKSLAAHKVRLALTGLAIVLGVSFMAGTFVLTDTVKHSFDNLFKQVNANVDVVVQGRAPVRDRRHQQRWLRTDRRSRPRCCQRCAAFPGSKTPSRSFRLR